LVVAFVACALGNSFFAPIEHLQSSLIVNKASDIQKATCRLESCATSGQFCVYNTTLQIHCLEGTYCNNSVCTPYLPVGASCTAADIAACEYGCNNGKCRSGLFGSLLPGAPCSSSDDCSFSNSTTSIGNCVNGKCFGLALGAKCDADYTKSRECINAFCNASSVCTAYLSKGATCLRNISSPCAGLLSCLSQAEADSAAGVGTCVLSVLPGEGTNCTTFCNENLYCGTDRVCHKLPSNMSTVLCETDVNCTNGQSCSCNSVTGVTQCYAQVSPAGDFNKVASDLQSCMDSNSCFAGGVYANDCYFSNCGSEWCAYYTWYQDLYGGTIAYPSCYKDYYRQDSFDGLALYGLKCGSSNDPDSMTLVYIGIAAGVVIVVAFIGCFFYRRRSEYRQI